MLASATTFLDTRSICVLFALPANTSSFNLSAFSAASSISAVVLSIRVVVSSAIFSIEMRYPYVDCIRFNKDLTRSCIVLTK